jgi:hypothetical protein
VALTERARTPPKPVPHPSLGSSAEPRQLLLQDEVAKRMVENIRDVDQLSEEHTAEAAGIEEFLIEFFNADVGSQVVIEALQFAIDRASREQPIWGWSRVLHMCTAEGVGLRELRDACDAAIKAWGRHQ